MKIKLIANRKTYIIQGIQRKPLVEILCIWRNTVWKIWEVDTITNDNNAIQTIIQLYVIPEVVGSFLILNRTSCTFYVFEFYD